MLILATDKLMPLQEIVQTIQLSSGDTAHNVSVLTRPVLDAYVLQQIKMVVFQLKTGSTFQTVQLQQIPRSVKDAFRSF